MSIREEDRYFGEGISSNGEEDPQKAYSNHKEHLRIMRLKDLLGNESKQSCGDIAYKFENIALAVDAADSQALSDNVEFIKKHNIQT